MLARQWNRAPRIDSEDVLSIDFEEIEDPDVLEFGFEIDAVMEVAYGHRKLASWLLKHWGHITEIETSEQTLTVYCIHCEGESISLEKRSLKGIPER